MSPARFGEIAGEKNRLAAFGPPFERVFGAVFFRQFQIDALCGYLEHKNPCRPTGVVNMGVKILFHQFKRLAFKVAEMVLIDKPPGINFGPGRNRPEFLLLLIGQRFVNRLKIIVLVFAHRWCLEKLDVDDFQYIDFSRRWQAVLHFR